MPEYKSLILLGELMSRINICLTSMLLLLFVICEALFFLMITRAYNGAESGIIPAPNLFNDFNARICLIISMIPKVNIRNIFHNEWVFYTYSDNPYISRVYKKVG